MADRVEIVKGFQDAPPSVAGTWSWLETKAREVFARYGYHEVRLPVVERTELFARAIGESADIVEKEMFTFPDRKGRSLTLRPEGTAGLVRAYLEAGKGRGETVKWFYLGPMFRYERPQKGRYRQFHQIGAEAIGYPGPGTDAETIAMLADYLAAVGAPGVAIELNSLGCPACRPAYRQALLGYLVARRDKLCPDCVRRLERNPLRVLDCKEPGCKQAVAQAPIALDFLDPACKTHLAGVQSDLAAYGVKPRLNPRIVRGLDYYTRTVFECLAQDGLGSQNAVAAGGRYDGLVEEFGGPSVPGIGFAIGLERLALLAPPCPAAGPDYFIAPMGAGTRDQALALLGAIRSRGLSAEADLDDPPKNFKGLLKAAAKAGAKHAVIIGERELAEGAVAVKDLTTGAQVTVAESEFLAGLKPRAE